MSSTDSRRESVNRTAASAASHDRAPTTRAGNATKVAPDQTTASPERLGPDPESFLDIARDNVLVKVAVALFVVLAVIALLIAVGR
jgi:hypothetical protein